MTRPARRARIWTPLLMLPNGGFRIAAKRCCNGCEAILGDVDQVEITAAMAGLPLPDVRDECPTCSPGLPDRPARCCACGRLAYRSTQLCGTDWIRLPTRLRNAVIGTHAEGSIAAHAIAVDRARAWLTDHPMTAVPTTTEEVPCPTSTS